MKGKKKIFISHSEKNKDFVTLLLNYLVSLGVKRENIFCSSDYRSGVHDKISDDVFAALKKTRLDIIVLSNEYKKSEYCLNESGVIRSKGQPSTKLVITLPGIRNGEHAGFIGSDYYQYRFDTTFFPVALAERLQEEVKKLHLINVNRDQQALTCECFQTKIVHYRNRLPIIDNLSVNWAEKNDQERAKLALQQAYLKTRNLTVFNQKDRSENYVFYKEYERNIVISKGETKGKIRVRTITSYVIVNLSDTDIIQTFSSQFLKIDQGLKSYEDGKVIVNGETTSGLVRRYKPKNSAKDNWSPYISSGVIEVKTKAHSSDQVIYESTYEISPDLFFQSKVIEYPCGQYCIRANFTGNFLKSRRWRKYIFRYQIIPPNPNDLHAHLVPSHLGGEAKDKINVFASYTNGFPAGGGYTLTLSKV